MKKTLAIAFLLTFSMTYAQKAQKVLNKYIDALGGKNKLESVQSLLQKGKIESTGQSFDFEKYQNKNGDGYMKMSMMGMELTVYAIKDGKGFMMNQQMGYDELDEETAKKMAEGNKDFFNGSLKLKEKSPEYAGMKEMDGKKYEVVKIKDEDGDAELYFDPSDHLLKYMVAKSDQGEAVVEFSDYKKIDGIRFAHKMTTKSGGQVVNTMLFEKIEVNPAHIDESNFQMPE